MAKEVFFKALKTGRKAPHNDYQWPDVGVWTKKEKPQLCNSGWHVMNVAGLSRYIEYCGASELWLCEVRGKKTACEDGKMAVEQARLVRKLPMPTTKLVALTKKYRNMVIELTNTDLVKTYLPYIGETWSRRDFGRNVALFHALYTGKRFNRFIVSYFGTNTNTNEMKRLRAKLKAVALDFLRELEEIWDINMGLPSNKEVVKL